MSQSSSKVLVGDSREVLRGLPDLSFDMCITSPPYWNLRDYTKGNALEIGREPTPQQYVQNLLKVFSLVGKKLKKTGSLWVNIGETYKDGAALGIPDLFDYHMREIHGWKRVNKIVWAKPDAMAESTQRRFKQSWEPLFWYVKDTKEYYFNPEASKIAVSKSAVERLNYKFNQGKSQDVSRMRGMLGDMSEKVDLYLQRGVNAGDVWIIHTNKIKVKHAAPYPIELCVRPIVATCPESGSIIDPFCGSGTTGVAAHEVGGSRSFVGIELDQNAAEEARGRLQEHEIQPNLL